MAIGLPRRRDTSRDIDARYDEHALVVTHAEHEAAGVKAVMVSLRRGLESMGAFAYTELPIRVGEQAYFPVTVAAPVYFGRGRLSA